METESTTKRAAPRRRRESEPPKSLAVVAIEPPPPQERRQRAARFADPGERHTRYTLPRSLRSSSPVGYRTRLRLSRREATEALRLLSLARPTAFVDGPGPTEQELFEEASLGVLSSRQSTNFRGHRQVTLEGEDAAACGRLLAELRGLEAPVLAPATHVHVVLTRPYRTPFTLLLTLVGHMPVLSLVGVPYRALRKRLGHVDDIPTIGYLQHLHLGILADGMERAAVLASSGARRAQIFLAPFASPDRRLENADVLRRLEALAGLGAADRLRGWRVGLVAQIGAAGEAERVVLPAGLDRKLGANLLAFRSERILPGVNQDAHAPEEYQEPQHMDVPEELTVQAGRAAYNAFAHVAGCGRERAKDLLLLERIDALSPEGKRRAGALRAELNRVMDQVIERLPKWLDVPSGRAFTRGVNLGRKAFGLTGQRIYIAGLSRAELEREHLDWELAVTAVGAAAARSALYVELMGCVDLPSDCDLLAGVCLMAGPVNQNDIGKRFYGHADLLSHRFNERDPTSLLVWTLKAKTVADPIGNEEQLLNPARRGKLVDLRPGPHEVVLLRRGGRFVRMRAEGDRTSEERAFADQGNFVVAPDGTPIAGNAGEPWARPTTGA